ncbi:hypothetical protein SprV_0100140600 [Sparganum proliferum]
MFRPPTSGAPSISSHHVSPSVVSTRTKHALTPAHCPYVDRSKPFVSQPSSGDPPLKANCSHTSSDLLTVTADSSLFAIRW